MTVQQLIDWLNKCPNRDADLYIAPPQIGLAKESILLEIYNDHPLSEVPKGIHDYPKQIVLINTGFYVHLPSNTKSVDPIVLSKSVIKWAHKH